MRQLYDASTNNWTFFFLFFFSPPTPPLFFPFFLVGCSRAIVHVKWFCRLRLCGAFMKSSFPFSFVLCFRTRFSRYQSHRVPFLSFTLPDLFLAVSRASDLIFIFCMPELIFDGINYVGSRFFVLLFEYFPQYATCLFLSYKVKSRVSSRDLLLKENCLFLAPNKLIHYLSDAL
jgi:hypothetical protein